LGADGRQNPGTPASKIDGASLWAVLLYSRLRHRENRYASTADIALRIDF
jgi:hypothetical protein